MQQQQQKSIKKKAEAVAAVSAARVYNRECQKTRSFVDCGGR